MEARKITVTHLGDRKPSLQSPSPQKIVAVTAYDYTMAKLLDELVDIVLVGDSLGMIVQGERNTLTVSLEQVIYHSRCVAKAVRHAHLVADMPFMTFQINEAETLKNAGRLISEGRAEAVKLEGGVRIARVVERLATSGIPVLGHLGLTPQSVHAFGGYKIQGRTDPAKETLIQDALALEDAGVYAMVLEGIPAELAKIITERVKVPTIGIGAGPFCDGQVLVSADLLGMNTAFHPKFVKRYANLTESIRTAVNQFVTEVREGEFPTREHSF